MPCHTRMRTILMQGFLWLCLLHFTFVISVIEPGYLDFDNLPDTNFSCVGKVIGGYYADLETSCQMFHVCTIGQSDEPMDIRFLCLNGTVFDQETRVCERVDEVDCSKSEKFYSLNLELYGNTAPPIVEEPEVTEPPKKPTTTTTTTPIPTTTPKPTRHYYTTPMPTATTPTHGTPKVITSHQFPVNSPTIRFNPEEINIRLTPGTVFHKYASVTTHTTGYKDDRPQLGAPQLGPPQLNRPITNQKPKSVVSYGLQHTPTQNYHYDYAYQQTETSEIDYRTDLPSEYIYNSKLGEYDHKEYQSTQHVFSATATKPPPRTDSSPYPSSTLYPSSVKPPLYHFQHTDKPPLQLPIPLLPTLSPLTFSSPAPFTLNRHYETKRSNDHQLPRVVVSASASVSDANGRKVNYSLGTIGASLLGKAPSSYDEYKEDDVSLDPFYHDVPKVKPRQKREINFYSYETTTEGGVTDSTTNYVDPTDESTTNKAIEENTTAHPDHLYQETTTHIMPTTDSDLESTTFDTKHDTTTELPEENTHWLPPDYVDDNYEGLTYMEPPKPQTTDKPPFDYIDDNYERVLYKLEQNITGETTTVLSATDYSTTELYETSTLGTEAYTEQDETTVSNLVETTTDLATTLEPTEDLTVEPTTNANDSSEETTQHPTTDGSDVSTTPILSTQEYREQSDATEGSLPTVSTRRYSYMRNNRYGTKPTRARHRFSSPTIQLSQSVLKLQGNKLPFTTSEPQKPAKHYKNKLNKFVPTITIESTTMPYVKTTDSLSKSVNPTEAKNSQAPLPTTPITKAPFTMRFIYDLKFSFNCIGKELKRFYEDPRDCRLFHYCTPGYTSTQVLDMKFVCDFGTYFDLDKLICTRNKPMRCR